MQEQQKISEEKIKDLLYAHEKLLTGYHEQLLSLYEEMEDAESLIHQVSLHGLNLNTEGGSHTNTITDLSDVVEKHLRLVEVRAREIRAEIWRITEEMEQINRVWICYQKVPSPSFQILHDLYIERMSYQVAEGKSKVSHRTFEKYRKAGLVKIQELYQSPALNLEIINQNRKSQKRKHNKKENRNL